ncbi:MAG: alpha-2-macroglobulin family protein [Proteobacteria bacterium]|nr:alpha-2-macroglobulin family protein [Pseudomonadota bacterium]
MLALLRTGIAAGLLAMLFVPATIAQPTSKPFARADLADAAIRLEAQIKADAGAVAKSAATLRREADVAFAKNDPLTGMKLLSQAVAAEPGDAAIWKILARTILQIRAANDSERGALLARASTAAYIAYQRATSAGEESEGLAVLGRALALRRLWRPALDAMRLSLDLREVADVRGEYEKMRDDHGFRLLDYTVDSDAASPRACFQFSEALAGKRADYSPFIAVAGIERPALSSDDKQICVEGLRHGERYTMTVRAGLASVVRETLARSAQFTIYVRDRKPFARFAGKAYVLARTGQKGIPVVSVNTNAVSLEVYRVGDRNLTDTVLGRDFQRNLDRYEVERIANRNGTLVWKGVLKVESSLNVEATTAFAVDEVLGSPAPGVYAVVAEAAGAARGESYEALSTQWFIVSDLGLTAFSGNDGIHVFVNSLATAEPRGEVDVRLLARNNEVLATRRTDRSGHAVFAPGLARGGGGQAPAMLVGADPRGDYSFLSLRTPAFELSDRGVTGRPAPVGLDAFVYPERGVYRRGESVHLTALLRDGQGRAVLGAPLTMVIERPDGVEYRRAVLPDAGIGGRAMSAPITATAPGGTWRAKAFADPKGAPIGEATFLVEDYVPDRLEFDLKSPAAAIASGKPIDVIVDGRYLYGAPAANLDLEGEIVVGVAKERPGYRGYHFGSVGEDEDLASERAPIEELPQTDAAGRAAFAVRLGKLPATTRPLEARVVIRMAESGGRAVERAVSIPVVPSANMIGVKPLFKGRSLRQDDMATFDIALVAPDGKAVGADALRYEMLKIETKYQWYRRGSSWNWEAIKSTRRVADGVVAAPAEKPGRISVAVSWGRYRLDVSSGDPNAPLTSIAFDAGFYAEASADTPDLLEIALDKSEYGAGDTMNVAITAPSAGKLDVNIVGESLLATVTRDIPAGQSSVPVTLGRDWSGGAYVVATLRRPLDAGASRMPGRAIGVQWFSIDRRARTLSVDLKSPALARPGATLQVPMRIAGLAAGEEARVVVAAVDVGILNLTNYKPPQPEEHYLGQRALSAAIRDIYGQLIDGMQGARGQLRSGGDAAAALQASPPTQAPLALYSGIVTVRADGAATVSFEMPQFAGTVRVMAVAWSGDKVGHGVSDVVVRDPVVLTATLPRFLLSGDQSNARLELDNVEGAAGEYRVAVAGTGPLKYGADASHTLRLGAKERGAVALPLTALGAGIADITVRVSGPGEFRAERSYRLAVRPPTQIVGRRTVKTLARGESLTLSRDLFAELVEGTGSIGVSIGPSSALDAATLLNALDRYPFGCSEQIASRALPLLYVNDLASEAHIALDEAVDQRVRDAIDRLLARQDSSGSFGLWSAGGGDVWLDAYITDFLTRARERGFAVPDIALRLALDRLRNFAAIAAEPRKDVGRDLAYALYVLARSGAAPVGDLRYVADTQIDAIDTPLAKAQIAAALSLLGDRVRAERVFAAAVAAVMPPEAFEFGRVDYGSTLRDAAAVVALAIEGGAPRPAILNAVARVEAARSGATFTSTQENAWMVLAARALARDFRISLDVDGEARKEPLYRTFKPAELTDPVRITNTGDAPLQAVVSVNGAPITAEPPAEKGFKIERLYHTLSGEPADPANTRQNTRFAVVLKITEPRPQYGRIIVADYLPAGFEIDNPRLVSSGEAGSLPWIEDAAEPVHAEFRDDRFTAAFDRKASDPATFTVAYIVRAVSPGRYVLPQAFVEDMYRPDRFGRTTSGQIEVTAAR